MRIIHVLHSHGYGGAESHALMMMKGQQAAGHDVFFAGPLDSWIGHACAEAGIEALHIGMHGMLDLVSHWKLMRLARQWRADIVHGHLIRGAMYAGIAGHLDRRPVAICTAHATTAKTHMHRCAHIIAVSDAVRTNLIAAGYAADRISMIHNGVPDAQSSISSEDRARLRAELGIPAEITAVVNAGRFVYDKGQDLLVEALAQTPPEMHLYLIGDPDTEFGAQVKALPHAAGRIHFLGYRPDVQRILPAFDMYVLSSRREALSLSLVEAFAARLPVVATTVGGVPEIVLHERTGLQVRPNDPSALGQAMVRLHANPDLAKQLATDGRHFFEQHLTADSMLKKTLSVYERALSATRHR